MPTLGEAAVLLSVAKKEAACERGGEALEAAKKAQAAYKELSGHECLWNAEMAVMGAMIANDQADDALKEWERIKSQESGDQKLASGLRLKAEALLAQCKWSEAADAAKEASASSERAGDACGNAMALLTLAKALLKQSASKAALQAAEKALSLFNENDDDSGEASAWLSVMTVRLAAGAYEGAMAASFAAIALYCELGDQLGEAKVLLKLAEAQIKKKMFSEALPSALKALAQFQKTPGSMLEIPALDAVVKAYIGRGETFEAVQVAKASVSTCTRLGKKKLSGLAMQSLALAHSADGWQTEALEVADDGMKILKELGDKKSQAISCQLRAELLMSMSKLEDALIAGESSKQFFKEVGDSEGEAVVAALVDSIKDMIQKNPGLQEEVEQRKKKERELDLLLLNEVTSALATRNTEEFKEKYDRLQKTNTITEEEVTSAMTSTMQVDWEASQNFITDALDKPGMKHLLPDRQWTYFLSRTSGMHYGPNFRAVKDYGIYLAEPKDTVSYGVLTLHNEVRDADWESVSCYHPPMYDCGLQVQQAESGATLVEYNFQKNKLEFPDPMFTEDVFAMK